jgi:NTP pyrophosphatase (non-canonical NTP hydrolase)
MTMDEYQEKAQGTAVYPKLGENLCYPAMKLAGEAGEYCDKVGKRWRNTGSMASQGLSPAEIEEYAKELGDVLWYIAASASELGLAMEQIAQLNLKKLADRKERGVIKGAGDNR